MTAWAGTWLPFIRTMKTCNWTKGDLRSAAVNAPDHDPGRLRLRLEEALADSPVVLVHGPRQRPKSALVHEAGMRQKNSPKIRKALILSFQVKYTLLKTYF